MKFLGVRNYSGGIRYCILEPDVNGKPICINLEGENLIRIPKEYIDNCEEMLVWCKNEINRIIDKYCIESVGLKHNENTPGRYTSLKKIMFMDCIVTLVSLEKNIPFSSYSYNQIGINSSTVQAEAEILFGRTSKKWDSSMADAMMVAYKQYKDEV